MERLEEQIFKCMKEGKEYRTSELLEKIPENITYKRLRATLIRLNKHSPWKEGSIECIRSKEYYCMWVKIKR